MTFCRSLRDDECYGGVRCLSLDAISLQTRLTTLGLDTVRNLHNPLGAVNIVEHVRSCIWTRVFHTTRRLKTHVPHIEDKEHKSE